MKKLLLLSALVATVVTLEVQASAAVRKFMHCGMLAIPFVGAGLALVSVEMSNDIQLDKIHLEVANSDEEFVKAFLAVADANREGQELEKVSELKQLQEAAWAYRLNRIEVMKELYAQRDENLILTFWLA